MSFTPMKTIRSFLFVPGNKPSWMEKVIASKADALILDLEDSVPHAHKAEARGMVKDKLAWLAEQKQRIYVRINRTAHMYDFEDILAVVSPHTEGVMISKPCGPEDIHAVAAMLGEAEYRAGLPIGSTRIIPLLETARAMELAYPIALHDRVPAIVGATCRNADAARALGMIWTPGGRESLYLMSRAVMAARAAGKLPIGGVWQQVHDIEGLTKSAQQNRELGMTGELALHPSNVATLNQIFSPTPDEVKYYEGMIAALEQAQAQGRASTLYDGEHIDIAHVKTAREIIDLAKSFNS